MGASENLDAPAKEQPPDPDRLLEHADALLRYAAARVRDRETAEDLVQEVLVTAVGRLGEFSGGSSLRTWLIGILRHKILDHYRWRARHPGDQPGAGEDGDGAVDDPWFTPLGVWKIDPNQGLPADFDPGRAAERSELREALRRCIERLPESLHRTFVLRELEELEPEEVCRAAGIGRESLAVFLYRARQSLRECLQRKGMTA